MSKGGTRPGAGRPRGSRNRRTLEVQEMLDNLGCNPVEGLAHIAMNDVVALGVDQDVPIQLRARAYEVLAQYTAPKLKSSELKVTAETSNNTQGVSRAAEIIAKLTGERVIEATDPEILRLPSVRTQSGQD